MGPLHIRTEDKFFLISSAFYPRIIGLDSPRKTGGGLEWPPNSPDLNVCDFFLWGYLKDRVDRTNPKTIDELKERIVEEFEGISHDIRHRAIEAFQTRLHHVVSVNGSHFENIVH